MWYSTRHLFLAEGSQVGTQHVIGLKLPLDILQELLRFLVGAGENQHVLDLL